MTKTIQPIKSLGGSQVLVAHAFTWEAENERIVLPGQQG
jgi:hypothetical protein